MTSYAELRPHLRTGDAVLFSGAGKLSGWIKRFTRSKFSHVGMVVVQAGEVMLWESTTLSNLRDVHLRKRVKGPQTVYLSQRLETYPGRVYWRPLTDNASDARRLEVFHSFRRELQGRPYERSRWEMLRAAWDWGRGQRPDLSSVFCSEGVAEYLQRLGAIDREISANEYVPADFAPSAASDEGLVLHACYAEELVEIAA